MDKEGLKKRSREEIVRDNVKNYTSVKLYTQSEVERLCIEARIEGLNTGRYAILKSHDPLELIDERIETAEQELESLKETKLNKETK